MLISVWYPASKGGAKMRWEDFVKLGGAISEGSDSLQLNYLRKIIALKWVFNFQISDIDYFSALRKFSNSFRNAPEVAGKFPLIIATARPIHYAASFEFFASHGFIVASYDGAFPENKLTDDSPQFFVQNTDMMGELMVMMSTFPSIDQSNISVFGHGGGIQPAMYLAMRSVEIKRVVNLDGAFFGPRSKSTLSFDYHPDKLTIPLLHIVTDDLHKQEERSQFNALKNPVTRVIIKPGEFKHHDLTSFGLFLRRAVDRRGDARDMVNKIFFKTHKMILSFLKDQNIKSSQNDIFGIEHFNKK